LVTKSWPGFCELFKLTHGCIAEALDGTQIIACIQSHKAEVEVHGTRGSVADIGEQLAWIGSALRSSPIAHGPVYCCAQVKEIGNKSPDSVVDSGVSGQLCCSITFRIERPEVHSGNGRCWYGLFRNPVIAKGFPIPHRLQRETGLEIPLPIMSGLAQAKRITTFDGNVYMKGFSTMLFPAEQVGNLVLWHLLYNEDGKRLSYLDNRVNSFQCPSIKHIGLSYLETSRHIVGWSTSIKVYTGIISFSS
jgi:hypothetical protein